MQRKLINVPDQGYYISAVDLTVTSDSINQVKKGPFTKFLNHLYGSDGAITLDQAIQESINDAMKQKGNPTCNENCEGCWTLGLDKN